MTKKETDCKKTETRDQGVSRRGLFKGAATLVGSAAAGGLVSGVIPSPLTSRAASATDKPLKLGFQAHRTGIGAGYGAGMSEQPRPRSGSSMRAAALLVVLLS